MEKNKCVSVNEKLVITKADITNKNGNIFIIKSCDDESKFCKIKVTKKGKARVDYSNAKFDYRNTNDWGACSCEPNVEVYLTNIKYIDEKGNESPKEDIKLNTPLDYTIEHYGEPLGGNYTTLTRDLAYNVIVKDYTAEDGTLIKGEKSKEFRAPQLSGCKYKICHTLVNNRPDYEHEDPFIQKGNGQFEVQVDFEFYDPCNIKNPSKRMYGINGYKIGATFNNQGDFSGDIGKQDALATLSSIKVIGGNRLSIYFNPGTKVGVFTQEFYITPCKIVQNTNVLPDDRLSEEALNIHTIVNIIFNTGTYLSLEDKEKKEGE